MGTPTKPWREWLAVLAVVVGPLAAALPPRDAGAVIVQEWTAREMGGHPRLFRPMQSPSTGIIYTTNGESVQEFDGAKWRTLAWPTGGLVDPRDLVEDDTGRLWGVANNNVLRFSADPHGRWQGESLMARLPEAARLPGTGLRILRQGDTVWAVMTEAILAFSLRDDTARSWRTERELSVTGMIDGEPWFGAPTGTGRFLRFQNDRLEPAPAPPLPEGIDACVLEQAPGGEIQVTHTAGVLALRQGAWVPLSAGLDHFIRENGAAHTAVRLADGRRVIGLFSGLLVVAGADGQVHSALGEAQGVRFGGRHHLLADREGGVWITRDSGLLRVQLDSAVTRFGRAQGLRGNVRRLVAVDSTLWAIGAGGLFEWDPARGAFRQRLEIDALGAVGFSDGSWVAGGLAGTRAWSPREGGRIDVVDEKAVLSLIPAWNDPERFFTGHVNEVRVHHRSARGWEREAVIEGLGEQIYGLTLDGAGVLWMAAGHGRGLWRAEAPGGDWTKAQARRVGGGLPAAIWLARAVDGEAVIYGREGIWRTSADGSRCEPDARFAGLPQGPGTPVQRVAPGAAPGVIYVVGDAGFTDRVWRGVRRGREEHWSFTELPLAETRGHFTPATLLEDAATRTLWMGGGGGVLAVDLSAPPPGAPIAPAAKWRELHSLRGDRVFLGGAHGREAVTLPHAERAVVAEFAAAAYRANLGGGPEVEYRTRVAGVDREWSGWAKTSSRELNNLPAGTVRLEVQARNFLGAEGPVAALALVVPPFWWETWWARALAVFAGAATVAVAVRWLVRRQFQQRIALLEAQAAVQQERLRIARDMHDDLGSTLASIVHLSSGPEGHGQLARIHDASRDLVQRTRDIVWAATPQHDSLESLVEQMSAHAERTLGDRGIAVKVDLPADVPEEALPSAVRHDVFLAFKEAVNNAAKYSQAKTARVRVTLQPEALLIELADDGVGFAAGEVKGTGHGLPNLRNRLAAFGGSADITSAPGRGTTVTLRVPRSVQKS